MTPAFVDSLPQPTDGEFLGGGTTPNTGGRRNRGLTKEKGRKLDKAGGKAEGGRGEKKNKLRCASYYEAIEEGLLCVPMPYYGCGTR